MLLKTSPIILSALGLSIMDHWEIDKLMCSAFIDQLFIFYNQISIFSSSSLSPRAGRAASPGRSPASRKFKSKALQLSLSKKFWLLSFLFPVNTDLEDVEEKCACVHVFHTDIFLSYLTLFFCHCPHNDVSWSNRWCFFSTYLTLKPSNHLRDTCVYFSIMKDRRMGFD